MISHISSVLTIALCLLAAHNANAINWPKKEVSMLGFSWTDCGAASDIVHVKSLAVAPSPVKLPGNITIDTSFDLGTSTATDLSVAVVMEKKIAGFYVKIPCIDNVGSCTYSDLCKSWAQVCPGSFEKYGLPCTCPFPAKTYTVSDVGVAITQSLPGVVDGEYRITANIASAASGHLGCLQIIVDLSK